MKASKEERAAFLTSMLAEYRAQCSATQFTGQGPDEHQIILLMAGDNIIEMGEWVSDVEREVESLRGVVNSLSRALGNAISLMESKGVTVSDIFRD